MSFPVHVLRQFEEPLRKNLPLTNKFGGPVVFEWRIQTLWISLSKPKEEIDPNLHWTANQLVTLTAKYSRPKDTWTLSGVKGFEIPSKVKTDELLEFIQLVFSKAKEINSSRGL